MHIDVGEHPEQELEDLDIHIDDEYVVSSGGDENV
jgi:hypothetical protein